jgi:hypothetical protein
VEEEEEDNFYSADEGYDAFHPEDGEGEGEGTGSDSDQNSRLNALRPKVPHHLPSLLTFLLPFYLTHYLITNFLSFCILVS